MISVGIRLTDEVFPKPEEQIARLPATVSENPVMNLNGIDKNGKAHVNRIVLSRSANVELLRAESPSRVWVRLSNHITDKTLTFREPFELNPKTSFNVGDYALVPCDDRVYRRCRILEVNKQKNRVKVFCIDDAVVYWVAPNCLGEMAEYYMYFPWQAIQVSIVDIYPAGQSLLNKQEWTAKACQELSRVLTSFPVLKVEVVLSSVVFNDYAKPIPVRMFGLDADDHKTISIANIMSKNVPELTVYMPIIDAAIHEVYGATDLEKEPEEMLEYHQSFPTDWKTKIVTEEPEAFPTDSSSMTPEMEHSDWDPRQNSIPMLSIDQLRERYTYPDKDPNSTPRIMLAVEGRCTKSPYEWYARPIVKTGKNDLGETVPWVEGGDQLQEMDKVDWVTYGNDQLKSFAEQLDTYYSNPKNRRPLRCHEIQQMKKNFDVFAVCAVNEDKATFTGEWQRVMILNCEDFAEVRFLDSGGRDMVLTSSLYRIHRQHCRFPPMCLQLSMHGIATRINQSRVDSKWNIKEISNFKVCLREDVPIFIEVDDLARLPLSATNDPRPYMKKNVLLARDVKYLGESKTVIDRFVGSTSGSAQLSADAPVPWPVYQ